MADSKMINDHRAWLKDAEKGKTRACIMAIALFVFYVAVAVFNANFEDIAFTGFVCFIVILFGFIAAVTLFNGHAGPGRFFLIATTVIIVLSTIFPLMNNEVSSSVMALVCILEFVPPIGALIFTFANFYMRRYYSFMILYRAKKIYL